MSTRGAIAIGTIEKWAGVYQHSDSYPDPPHGLGPRVWDQIKKFGVERFISELLSHPGGWSSYPEICYCHDEYFAKRDGSVAKDSEFFKSDAPDGRLSEKADALFIEWVYVLDLEDQSLHVLKNQPTGKRVIEHGKHGSWKRPEYRFAYVTTFSLREPEPDWAKCYAR